MFIRCATPMPHTYWKMEWIAIISEYLGHRSLDSTLIYTHLTPLMRKGVADKINSLMGGLQ